MPSAKSKTTKTPGPKPKYVPTDMVVQETDSLTPRQNTGTRRSNHQILSAMIREILAEPIEGRGPDGKPLGWTRGEAVIRSMIQEAIGGSHQAAELLWEHGYGKVATPVELAVDVQIQKMAIEMKLDRETVLADPMLRQLLEDAGVPLETLPENVIEGNYRESDA